MPDYTYTPKLPLKQYIPVICFLRPSTRLDVTIHTQLWCTQQLHSVEESISVSLSFPDCSILLLWCSAPEKQDTKKMPG